MRRTHAMALQRNSLWPFILLISLWSGASAQDISSVTANPSQTFETGTTPSSLVVAFTPTNDIVTASTITITADAAIFATDANPAAAPTISGTGVTAGSPTAVISTVSTVYTVTLDGSAAATGGNEVTVNIPAAALTTLPTAGTVTLAVAADGNTGTGTGTFTVIAAPTITWSGSVAPTVTPTSLQVQVEIPKQVAIGGTISLVASQAIFDAAQSSPTQDGAAGAGAYVDMTNVGDTTSTFASASSGTTLVLTVAGSNVAAGTTITVLIKPTMLAALPSALGPVQLTISSSSDTFVYQKTGWLTIAAEMTGVTANPASFETGTTPNLLKVAFTPSNNIPTGDTITIDADAAIFATTGNPAAAPTISGTGVTAGSPTARIQNSRTRYQVTLDGGAAATGGNEVTVNIPAAALDTLPTAGAVTVTVAAGGNGGTASGTFTVIAAPTITWSGSQTGGDTPTSLQVQVEIPKQVAIGGTISLVASQAIFDAAQTSPTQDGAAGAGAYVDMTNVGDTTSTFASASSGTTLVLTVAGSNVAAGTTITVLIKPTMLAALPNVAGAVQLTISSSSDTFVYQKTGWLTIAAAVGVVTGDPVTWSGKRRAEFELPLNRLTRLLKMPDLELLAAPFQGTKQEQWIGRILIRNTTSHEELAQFDVHRDLSNFDRSTLANQGLNQLETLSFVVNNKCASNGFQFTCPEGTWGVFSKIQCNLDQYTPCREVVVIAAEYAKISIYTSSAKEYYGSAEEAFSHVHFDVDVFDVAPQNQKFLEGALPEMWGWRSLSDETRELLTKGDPVDVTFEARPLVSAEGCNEKCQTDVSNGTGVLFY